MLERSWTFGGTEAAATIDFALKTDCCNYVYGRMKRPDINGARLILLFTQLQQSVFVSADRKRQTKTTAVLYNFIQQ